MRKAFVITGVLFAFALVLVVLANYVTVADNNSPVYESMLVDKTFNRYVDVMRITDDIVNDSVDDAGNCADAVVLLQQRLDAVLNSQQLSSDGVKTTPVINITDRCSTDNEIDVNVSISFDSEMMHKEAEYSKTISFS